MHAGHQLPLWKIKGSGPRRGIDADEDFAPWLGSQKPRAWSPAVNAFLASAGGHQVFGSPRQGNRDISGHFRRLEFRTARVFIKFYGSIVARSVPDIGHVIP